MSAEANHIVETPWSYGTVLRDDGPQSSVSANLARCARLRQSILKRAFEGRLAPLEAPENPARPSSNPPLLTNCLGDSRG